MPVKTVLFMDLNRKSRMKHFMIPILMILLQQNNVQASEKDQVVPQTQEYNEHVGSFVDGTQPGSQPEFQSQGSQGQPLVPSLSRHKTEPVRGEQPERDAPEEGEEEHPRLVRQNAARE